VLGNAQILWVVDNLVDAAQNPHRQGLNQVRVLLVVDALEIEALQARYGQAVLGVIKNRVIDALVLPLPHISIQMLGKRKVRDYAQTVGDEKRNAGEKVASLVLKEGKVA